MACHCRRLQHESLCALHYTVWILIFAQVEKLLCRICGMSGEPNRLLRLFLGPPSAVEKRLTSFKSLSQSFGIRDQFERWFVSLAKV